MRLPNDYRFHEQRQRPIIVRPPRKPRQRRRRWRPRWSLLLIPAAVLLGAYVISHIELAFTWDDVMDALDIRDRQRYTMLAVLGCLCVAGVWIAKVLGNDKKDEK